MRKESILSVLAMVVLSAVAVSAQTVDDVINRAIAATGGGANLQSVKTMSMTMEGTMQGSMSITMVMHTQNPDKFRMEMQMMGREMVIASDGSDTWMQMMGRTMSVPGNQQGSNNLLGQNAGNQGLLMLKQMNAKYVGRENFRGAPADVLSVVGENGQEMKWYFSVDTGLPAGIVMDSQGKMITMTLSDYRDVAGLKFAHSMETLMGDTPVMTLTVKEIKINPPLDASMFSR